MGRRSTALDPEGMSMQLSLLAEDTAVAPAGLEYHPEFLSANEEAVLLGHIDAAEWLTDLSRRVLHYRQTAHGRVERAQGPARHGLPRVVRPARRGPRRAVRQSCAENCLASDFVQKRRLRRQICTKKA